MDIHPIRNEADYQQALAIINSLWERAVPATPDGDHLDVLITLVQAYERVHHPVLPPDPIEAIKFRAEQVGIGRKGLEGIIGSRARVAEVLSGTRALSIGMIRRLHRELDIPADILIQEVRRPTIVRGRVKTARSSNEPGPAKSGARQGGTSGRAEKRVA